MCFVMPHGEVINVDSRNYQTLNFRSETNHLCDFEKLYPWSPVSSPVQLEEYYYFKGLLWELS